MFLHAKELEIPGLCWGPTSNTELRALSHFSQHTGMVKASNSSFLTVHLGQVAVAIIKKRA